MTDLYGSDISTFAGPGNTIGLDVLFRPITGHRVALEQVARRLNTPDGTIPGAMTMDLLSIVQQRMTPVAMRRIEAKVRAVAERVEFVLSVPVCTLEKAAGNFRYRLTLRIVLADGPFVLVLGISDVTIALLRADRG